jgi:hypothetical protein
LANMHCMLSNRKRPPESSARILDSYVAGLRAEVARLSLLREHSKDMLSLAELDLQLTLKLQLIEDVSYCLGQEDEVETSVDMHYDSFPGIVSTLPSRT